MMSAAYDLYEKSEIFYIVIQEQSWAPGARVRALLEHSPVLVAQLEL